MYDNQPFRDYAKLVIATGINLQKGQGLTISTNSGTYGFARLLAEEGYKAGARFVRILQDDQHLNVYRAKYGDPETWDYYPDFLRNEYETYAQEGWARIALEDMEDLDISPPELQKALGHFRKVRSKKLTAYRDAQIQDHFPWCVIAVPGPKWASRLGLSVDQLWAVLKPILRLDQKDPGEAWQRAGKLLEHRAESLTIQGFSSLHFQGPGTDLTIGLIPGSLWLGGGAKTPQGQVFMPNIPTEEVFTTPDWRLTQGRVQVTRPVEVLGALVKGAWFVYENGRITDFGALEGVEALRNYLAVEQNAGCLGEVALVDGGNPIARTEILFGSILLDENASCHIALGFGYPKAIPQTEGKNGEDLSNTGCNVSLVHTDFMIGSPYLVVTGHRLDGTAQVLLDHGLIVFTP